MLKKNINTIKYLLIIGWSFLAMIAMGQICHYGITGIELILPCIFAVCTFVNLKGYKRYEQLKKQNSMLDIKLAIPLGIIVDVCSVIGNKFNMYDYTFEGFSIVDPVYIVFLLPFFICIFVLLFEYSDSISEIMKKNRIIGCNNAATATDDSDMKKLFGPKRIIKKAAVYGVIMFICWLPFYLTFWPGGVSNDNFKCINMINGVIPWTNHHPVIYTATMKLYMAIFAGNGNLNLALGMMVLAQMIMMSFTLGLSLVWLEYKGASKVWRYVSLAFMSLHSAFSMFSVCLTKDISFSCVVVLLILFLIDFCDFYKKHGNEDKKKVTKLCAVLGVLSFLVIITRNNGTLVMVVSLIAMMLAFKKIRKQVLIVALIVFSLNGLYKGPVWNALGIQRESFVEAASIPLTQIAYTIYKDGKIEGEDREYLESIMPLDKVKENFIPGYVDSYKFDEDFNAEIIDADKAKVIKVWWHLLPDNFVSYVEAYLFETCGYWHYGVTNTLCSEGVQPNDLGLYSTDWISRFTGISIQSLLSGLMLIVRKLPILCMFTQMAVILQGVILVACQCIRKNRKHYILALVPLFAIWCSIMIAVPAFCLLRYMLPVFFLWPVTIYMFFSVGNTKQ